MKQVKSLLLFLDQCWLELKKIHWPTHKELVIAFVVTLIIVFCFSIFLAFVDGVIGTIIRKIIFWVG